MPISTNLSPIPTTQIAVVSAFRELLLNGVEDFTPNNLFITDPDDDPPTAAMNQRFWGAVWILGGEFDRGLFTGSGQHDVRESAGVSLAVYRESFIDRSGQAAEAFMGLDPQALLRLKQKILIATVGQQLYWEQNALLTELLEPLRSDHPKTLRSERGKRPSIWLEFATTFQWDVSTVA